MKFTIEIEAVSIQELEKILSGLVVKKEECPLQQTIFPPQVDAELKKRPGRKPKLVEMEQVAEIKVVAEETVEEPAITEAKQLTITEAMDALKKVNATKGMNAAREVLAEFSAARISEVKKTDYASFITACESKCRT